MCTHKTLIDALQTTTELYAHQLAFTFLENGDTQELRYSTLQEKVLTIAGNLQKYIRTGDRVLICMPPSLDYICAALACFQAGGVLVPLYSFITPKSAKFIQSVAVNANANLLITNKSYQPSIKQTLSEVDLKITIAEIEQLLRPSQKWERPKIDSESLAVLMYTSGSTGNPKGVMLSHGNILHNLKILSEARNLRHHHSICLWMPFYHISGLLCIIALPIYTGVHCITFPTQNYIENPLCWLKAISDYNVYFSGATTFGYHLCLQSLNQQNNKAKFDLQNWKVAVVGGEAIRADVIQEFTSITKSYKFSPESFFTMFGLTESTMISTGNSEFVAPKILSIDRDSLKKNQLKIATEHSSSRLVSSGRPLQGMTVKIVDPETLHECSPNQIGEIWIHGNSIAQGYWHNKQVTEEVFRAQIHGDTKFFLRSGDLGAIYDGELFVTGRLKETIIIRGVKYYPEDIESTVRKTNLSFNNCAAFATTIHQEESLILAIEVSSEKELEEDYAQIRKQIALFHGISVYGFVLLAVGELPRTVTQKIQRTLCSTKVANKEWNIKYYTRPESPTIENMTTTDLYIKEATTSATKNLAILYAYLQDFVQKKLSYAANISTLWQKPLSQLSFDSLSMVKLLNEINKITQVDFPISILYDTQNSLLNICEQILQQQEPNLEAVDFATEVDLDLQITHTDYNNHQLNNILLTGATGFLGSYLLRDLLLKTSANIYCLVRSDALSTQEKIIQKLKSMMDWNSLYATRLKMIAGDLALPLLGLTETDFAFLSREVDTVVHSAAAVNFVMSYQELQSVNVDAVKTVLEFAGVTRAKHVHFLSTLGVFNTIDRHTYSTLAEENVSPDISRVISGYAQSKVVAELLCKEAQNKGVRVNIYRPSFITGDSKTGFCHTEDFLCRWLKGCLQLGIFPKMDVKLDMVPVDCVSDIVSTIVKTPSLSNETYHICNPHSFNVENFFLFFATKGYNIKGISLDDWLNQIRGVTESNELFWILPFLLNKHPKSNITFWEIFNQGNNPEFSFTNLSKALPDLPMIKIDEKLLEVYLHYFVENQFLLSAF